MRGRSELLGKTLDDEINNTDALIKPIGGDRQDKSIIVHRNVLVKMQDGVRLSTDIYRPAGGGKVPVILIRTPYGADSTDYTNFGKSGQYFVNNGYALAVQDVRGKYDSEGDWYGPRDERQDGSDTITWLGTCEWSNGNIGMMGPSYMGMVQYLVADCQNPYLKALFPLVAPSTLGRDASDYDTLAIYSSRDSYSNLIWMIMNDGRVRQADLPFDGLGAQTWANARKHLPRTDYPKIFGREMPWWPFLQNVRYGFWEEYYARAKDGNWSDAIDMSHWWATYLDRYRNVNIPIMHASGWWDCAPEQMIKTFQMVRQHSDHAIARNNQKLVIGPWPHQVGGTRLGEYDFGPEAAWNPDEQAVLWFDKWLKTEPSNFKEEPPVQVFVMGENRWRMAQDWPIPGTEFTPFYLHSNGEARLRHGGGTLSRDLPDQERPDQYIYDPGNPTPAANGPGEDYSIGPVNMSLIEERDDVLVYTSEALEAPVEVTGPLTATIYISTTAPSTDLFVRLVNVHPDGTAINTFATYSAIPYRTYWSKNSVTTDDGVKIIQANITLPPTSIVFKRGHRIRVEICSACAPEHHGLNVEPGMEGIAERWNVATQTIYHDKDHPSHIMLPIIPVGLDEGHEDH